MEKNENKTPSETVGFEMNKYSRGLLWFLGLSLGGILTYESCENNQRLTQVEDNQATYEQRQVDLGDSLDHVYINARTALVEAHEAKEYANEAKQSVDSIKTDIKDMKVELNYVHRTVDHLDTMVQAHDSEINTLNDNYNILDNVVQQSLPSYDSLKELANTNSLPSADSAIVKKDTVFSYDAKSNTIKASECFCDLDKSKYEIVEGSKVYYKKN